MNLLQVKDGTGRVIRTDLIDGLGVIDVGLLPGWPDGNRCGGTVTIMPMPGYQLNGHRWDCRCATCRPDLQIGGSA